MSAESHEVLYGELAPWWPLISPVEEYAEEASFVSGLLREHPRDILEVLELGSGGGHNAFHLKHELQLTLSDLSEDMLAQSELLNPECDHVFGDMRTLRLGRSFDAVFLHDAIDYLTTEADLLAAFATAYDHLDPGGLALLMPDDTLERFEASEEVGGSEHGQRAVRYLAWSFDPDPSDTWVQTEYVFALREGTDPTRIVHETHRTGLFGCATWLRLLGETGFDARRIREPSTEDREGRDVFLAVRSG